MNKIEKAVETLKYHIVDTTALLVETNPIFSAFEVAIAGISIEKSITARLLATAMGYAGLGGAYGKGRDAWRKLWKIEDNTSEKVKLSCDTVYNTLFNLMLSPPLYLVSGEEDFKKIAIGTACAVGIGFVNGPFVGYTVDAFRDLSGLKTNERSSYPYFVKRQSSLVKKGIAATLIATSIVSMALIYSAKSNYNGHINHNNNNQPVIQETTDWNINSLEER